MDYALDRHQPLAGVNGFEGAQAEAAMKSPLLLEKAANTDRTLGSASSSR